MIKGVRLGHRGASATEYTLIAVVIGVIALVALGRFGGGVGNRYSEATDEVDRARPGKVVREAEPPPQAAKMPDGEAVGAEPNSPGSPSGGDGRTVGVGGVRVDLSTVIWMSLAIVAVSMLMMTRIFRAAQRPKEEQQAEWKDESGE